MRAFLLERVSAVIATSHILPRVLPPELVELDKNDWSRTNRMHLVLVVPFKYERRSGKEKGWGDTGEAKNAQKQGGDGEHNDTAQWPPW